MVEGERQGPVTKGVLTSLVSSHSLQPTTLVWKAGFSSWIEARHVPELSPSQDQSGQLVRPAARSIESRPPEAHQQVAAGQPDSHFHGLGSEVVQAVHGSRSYVGHAIGAAFLYYIGFYIIGLIANLVFLSGAHGSKRISGVTPPGTGCLWAVLIFHLGIPLAAAFLFLILAAAGALSL